MDKREMSARAVKGNTGQSLPRSVQFTINILIFFAVVVVGSYLLGQTFSNIFPEQIQVKFDHYQEHKDEYDVIFVGSSLTRREIFPAVFDEALRERGHEIRSFNFGIPNMRFHESNVVIRRLLATKPDRLKWIFIDVGFDDRLLDKRNWFTDRVIWWHTPKETWSVLADIFDMDESLLYKARFAFGHIQHSAMECFHIGLGSRIVRESLLSDEALASLDALNRSNRRRRILQRRYAFQRNRGDYEQRLEEFRQSTNDEPQVGESYKRRFLDQAAQVRQADVEPIYLLPPVMGNRKISQVAVESDQVTLFAYNDPEQFFLLYRFESQLDHVHLNKFASMVFTRMVSKTFLEYLEDPS